MSVFIDTSALLAVLNRNDLCAVRAGREWTRLITDRDEMVTTSYVVLETVSIVQRRLGLEAVHTLSNSLLPVIDMHVVDASLHAAAMSNLLVANRRQLSLVDCCSFEFMRRNGISAAFAYDSHYVEQGFSLRGDLPV